MAVLLNGIKNIGIYPIKMIDAYCEDEAGGKALPEDIVLVQTDNNDVLVLGISDVRMTREIKQVLAGQVGLKNINRFISLKTWKK